MTIVAIWDSSGGNVFTMKLAYICTKHSRFIGKRWMQMEALEGWRKVHGYACFNPGARILFPYTGEEVEYFPIRSGGVADARSSPAASL